MKIVNFSHPLTAEQLDQLHSEFQIQVEAVLQVATHLDPERPFAEQAVALVDAAGLSAQEWQGQCPLVALPALHVAAAAVLAEIEGRAGHLPAVIRLKPVVGAATPRFAVAEILNLFLIRNQARSLRASN